MSDHEYTPKSKFGKWFNDRLPLLTLANHLTDYPTPKNLNTQIVTGLVLAMHYIAHADMAFDSVEHIMRDVNYGWLIRYIHANGASMFFLAVYIHIFRSLFYGSYRYHHLFINDGSCIFGLCTSMGPNEFLGCNCNYKSI